MEEVASEDAGSILERRNTTEKYAELLVTPRFHVYQDLAEKASRGAMTGTGVLRGGSPTGPHPTWKNNPA